MYTLPWLALRALGRRDKMQRKKRRTRTSGDRVSKRQRLADLFVVPPGEGEIEKINIKAQSAGHGVM